MSYKLDLGAWNGVFAVPNLLIDKYLKLARGNEIKVILYALRHGGEELSIKTIAKEAGLSEESVEEAFEYWLQQGLIERDGRALVPKEEKRTEEIKENINTEIKTPLNLKQEEKSFAAQDTQMPLPSHKFRAVRPDSLYVAKRINEQEELRNLIAEVEMCLGKTITPTLLSTIVNAYDDYNLPPEVIMMLFSYVKKIGKTSTPYIESVINEWGMSGVNSAEAADLKIKDLDDKSIAWKKVVRIFSMEYRSPSKKEEECAYRWIKTYLLPEELIREAYERCVNSTGKMQMRYINAILEKWHASGIKNMDELIKSENKEAESRKTSSSFDISEIKNIGLFD